MDCVYKCQAFFEEINHHEFPKVQTRPSWMDFGFVWASWTSRLIHLDLCETPETNLSTACLNSAATQYIPSLRLCVEVFTIPQCCLSTVPKNFKRCVICAIRELEYAWFATLIDRSVMPSYSWVSFQHLFDAKKNCKWNAILDWEILDKIINE